MHNVFQQALILFIVAFTADTCIDNGGVTFCKSPEKRLRVRSCIWHQRLKPPLPPSLPYLPVYPLGHCLLYGLALQWEPGFGIVNSDHFGTLAFILLITVLISWILVSLCNWLLQPIPHKLPLIINTVIVLWEFYHFKLEFPLKQKRFLFICFKRFVFIR